MRQSPTEEAYAIVTDEINDGTPECMTLEDLDPYYVRQAELFARNNGFPWPPGPGDFDRYYEWKTNER